MKFLLPKSTFYEYFHKSYDWRTTLDYDCVYLYTYFLGLISFDLVVLETDFLSFNQHLNLTRTIDIQSIINKLIF